MDDKKQPVGSTSFNWEESQRTFQNAIGATLKTNRLFLRGEFTNLHLRREILLHKCALGGLGSLTIDQILFSKIVLAQVPARAPAVLQDPPPAPKSPAVEQNPPVELSRRERMAEWCRRTGHTKKEFCLVAGIGQTYLRVWQRNEYCSGNLLAKIEGTMKLSTRMFNRKLSKSPARSTKS